MISPHKKPVTDLLHKNINGVSYVLSSSIDGTIKAWKLVENQLVHDDVISEVFRKHYDNGNPTIEI